MAKKTKCRFGNIDEESTLLTSEDSSNNNNSLLNQEWAKNARSSKRRGKVPSNPGDSNLVYSNDSFDRVYENTEAGDQDVVPSVPTRKTPKHSPKTPPSQSHGKFPNKKSHSPAATKKSPKRTSPRVRKHERKHSISPERTPKSRRSSPATKKARAPPSPKVSAGGCWQAAESEEETYHNASITLPPVDYRKDIEVKVESPCERRSPDLVPVACTSRCNGSCGGACGGPAPAIPEKLPAIFMTRKDLPPEPDKADYSAILEDGHSTVGDHVPGPHLSNLQSVRLAGLSHSYDPVYVPRSDANAMSRRLDNAGYVTSRATESDCTRWHRDGHTDVNP